jgi:hypothetical protein
MFKAKHKYKITTHMEHDCKWTARVYERMWVAWSKDYIVKHIVMGNDTREDAIEQAELWIKRDKEVINSYRTEFR